MKRIPILLTISTLALLVACASDKEKTQAIIDKNPSPIASNAPDWVNKGSGAFHDTDGSQVFYGVGIVSGVQNRALAVTTADDRGRAELAKILDTYVSNLGKSYMASTTAGDLQKSDEEQLVSQTLKTYAQFTLHGATPVNHWVDPTDGTVFSLVKLDMASVEQSISDSKSLDNKLSTYVQQNAAKSFDELSAEEAKHNGDATATASASTSAAPVSLAPAPTSTPISSVPVPDTTQH